MSEAPPFDLEDFLPYLLTQAAERSSLEFQRFYKTQFGMLRTEWRVLFHLGRYGPMTATEICTRAHIHKTKVSRAVAALVQKRFLSRRVLDHDRRQERLELTAHGAAVFEALVAEAERFDAEFAAALSVEDLAVLRRSLRVLAGLARSEGMPL